MSADVHGEERQSHSPGPWTAERFFQKHNERTPDRWCWGIDDAEGIGYLAILPEDDEALARADAALIAAAPDLLDALRVAVDAFARFSEDRNLYALSVHLDAHSRAGRLVEQFGRQFHSEATS